MQSKKLYAAIGVSLLIHLTFVFLTWQIPILKFLEQAPSNPMKLKIVGEDEGVKKDLIFVEKNNKQKATLSKKSALTLPAITPLDQKTQPKKIKGSGSIFQPQTRSALENLKISNKAIKGYLKDDLTNPAPREVLSAMDYTDVNFDLVVPKGVKEDELNKYEMVFYSFRKRTAIAYVNSFYKELNDFERTNPHLRFPLTSRKQEIAGRITYDKNGDILKIETLKYTQITRLQDFFMDVLQNMTTLPNPPKEIINTDDQFVINFVLTINESKTQ